MRPLSGKLRTEIHQADDSLKAHKSLTHDQIANFQVLLLIDTFQPLLKIAVYDSSAFPRGLRSLRSRRKQATTNPKNEQTRSTNKPKILKDFVGLAFKEPYTAIYPNL